MEHRIRILVGVSGRLANISAGSFNVEETVYEIEQDGSIFKGTLMQNGQSVVGGPFAQKLIPVEPFGDRSAGHRYLLPSNQVGEQQPYSGPFGAGKTVVQHQVAKFANVDIVIYVGCGERGNEMTGRTPTISIELIDPSTGFQSIMQWTVLIANTSNMPVAAR